MRNGLGDIQSVLLLGGSSDIGLAIIKELAKSGRLQRAVLAVRSEAAGQSSSDLLKAAGVPNVDIVLFDATDESTYAGIFEAAFTGSGIDCVVSAFGLLGDDVDSFHDLAGVARLIDVNYRAAVLTGTIAVDRLKSQGHGSFVVLSSVAAERARADNFLYASTKAGLDAWASGLADALHGTGVDVTVVRPGFVHTKMTENAAVAPMATTPEVVAEVVVEAIHKRQPLVWAPKTVRPLMSTLRHLPRPVFRAVVKKSRGD